MIHKIGALLQEKLFWGPFLDWSWGGVWLYFNLTSWALEIIRVSITIPYLTYTDKESGKEYFAQWSLDVGTHIGPLSLSAAIWEPDNDALHEEQETDADPEENQEA